MRLDHRSIARGTLVAAAMSMVLAACGGGGGTTEEDAPRTPAVTTEPTGQVDPIEGEWRADFTCKESLRAIESTTVVEADPCAGGKPGILLIEGVGWTDRRTG